MGARATVMHPRAITFGADAAPDAMAGLLADLEDAGTTRLRSSYDRGAEVCTDGSASRSDDA